MKKNELTYKDLKNSCDPDVFTFETTEELDNVGLVYGQERAVVALQFGLSINSKGYNIYVEGPAGVGKTMYSKEYVSPCLITPTYNLPSKTGSSHEKSSYTYMILSSLAIIPSSLMHAF